MKNSVGGTRLDLFFESAEDALRGRAVVGGVADGVLLSVPSDGSAAHLYRVLDDLLAARVNVSRVSAHRPTLDDVFTSLTAVAS